MIVVALHGAFRGGWYWEPVAEILGSHGVEVVAPDLEGERLSDWIGIASDAIEQAASQDPAEPVVVLAHSLGGVVAQGLPLQLAPKVDRIVLLDAPLIGPGQRPVDVSSPGPIDHGALPPRDFMVPPNPVGPEQGFVDPELAGWVNERLTAVAMGPQLDQLPNGLGELRSINEVVFCELTPAAFPSGLTRARCDEQGVAYALLDGAHHDVAVLDPAAVAALVVPGVHLLPPTRGRGSATD